MMKKKALIIGSIVVVAIVVVLVILLNKTTYTIRVSIVDEKSPDRILSVYDNKNNKVDFNRIETLDGTVLCDEINSSVYYGNIVKLNELRVVLKDNSKVIAQINKEEVK
jgi:hypothetical protein